ncbi:RxLR-like protein [Plasmopara halstedii]|uniref:Secreted RxLR effector protein RXLR-C06 n=1 Tax=Plasmopara halstedii TaxID=4781 RepID=RLR06_PLAHL|nr:RxLR-like protein [Plasmopara halstedii]A0A0P1AXF0.1 RecName: Full=Secreted RxLR effector protein RXLR-C06; Flags: Precursor [Plasmopara halstedii]CEG45744.1 RxLR-like protein [Plasmopara halstedii]|eukprot:XP_024582113.1 RxLR-like protein [Plasmopara halstedii]
MRIQLLWLSFAVLSTILSTCDATSDKLDPQRVQPNQNGSGHNQSIRSALKTSHGKTIADDEERFISLSGMSEKIAKYYKAIVAKLSKYFRDYHERREIRKQRILNKSFAEMMAGQKSVEDIGRNQDASFMSSSFLWTPEAFKSILHKYALFLYKYGNGHLATVPVKTG